MKPSSRRSEISRTLLPSTSQTFMCAQVVNLKADVKRRCHRHARSAQGQALRGSKSTASRPDQGRLPDNTVCLYYVTSGSYGGAGGVVAQSLTRCGKSCCGAVKLRISDSHCDFCGFERSPDFRGARPASAKVHFTTASDTPYSKNLNGRAENRHIP